MQSLVNNFLSAWYAPYLIICLLAAIVFWRSWFLGYVVDDDVWHNHVENRKKNFKFNLKTLPDFIWNLCYGAGLFKNVKHDHLFSVFIHTLNACLLYRASGSLLAAGLWLINPINHQTSLWLNGRRYALSLTAVLIGWNWYFFAPAAALFCGWLHVSGFVFPLLFMATSMWWMPLLLIVAGIVGHKKIIKKIIERKSDFREGNTNQEISWRKIILYVKSVGWYVKNIAIPDKPSMYNLFLDELGYTKEAEKKAYSVDVEFLFGLFSLAGLAYLAIVHKSFWSFWFILFITPWCNLYQVTMNAADRYQSIAGAGLMVIIAQGLMMLPADIRVAAVSGLACFYLMKYSPLFDAYKSVERYHQYHIALDRALVTPRMFLCKMWIACKDPLTSYAIAKEGLRFKPTNFKLLLCMWEALWTMGDISKSLRALDVAEKYVPIGEEEDTKRFFGEIRERAKKRMDNGPRRVHNNGKPVVNKN